MMLRYNNEVIKDIGQFTYGPAKWHTPAHLLDCYLSTQKPWNE